MSRHPASLRRLALLLGLLAASPEAGQCAGTFDAWQIDGHAKTQTLYAESTDAWDGGLYSTNELRLRALGTWADWLGLEVAVTETAVYADHAPGSGLLATTAPYSRRFRLAATQTNSAHTAARLDIDRLCLRGTAGTLEWTIGRQALGFGRLTLVSPLDIVEPFAATALDTEVRPGVDAVRLVRYFGRVGQAGLVAVAGDTRANNTYLATFSHNLHGIDVLALAGSLRQRAMVGIGAAGEVGGLGLKAEVAAFRGRNSATHGSDLHAGYAIAGVEALYRCANGFTFSAEYLLNGAGAASSSGYIAAAAAASSVEGLDSLLGRHYLLFGPAYEIHPLVTVKGLFLHNLQDGSLFARPMVEVSVTDDLSLQLYWAFTAGNGGTGEFADANEYGGANLTFHF